MKRSVVLMNLDSIPWQNVQDMLDSVSTSHAFDNTERHRGAIECPEKGNRESLGESLEHKSDKEQLRDLGCAQSGEKELKGNLLALYKSLAGWWSQLEIDLFSQVTSDKIRGNGLQLH
ncbi:hypothetical protein TURU_052405 [Turdus rufiventris]|nr:hypothetical protein TURU_052405 [Turdus rufiventris]